MSTTPKLLAVQFSHLPVLMFVTVLVVSGCSGSSDPVHSDSQQAAIDSAFPVDSTDTVNDVSNDAPVVTETDAINEAAVNDEPTSNTESPVTSIPVVIDPLIQTRILVSFDISVPAYQSDELRLEVVWGELNLTAGWVGDEFWAVSGEFPTETQELLAVTFFDNNGAIELASFSQQFRTGSNGTEAFQISADQFDAERFDDDGDGVSNLDELIAGTDPTIDEDSLLEIRDSFSLSDNSRVSVSTRFEGRLSDERPFFDTVERIPVPGGYPGTLFRNIDIDADGNGTLTFNESLLGTRLELAGTRTNSGNAIAWEGTLYDYDGDYTLRVSFTNTITLLDDSTRSFIEESEGSHVGTYQSRWNINSSLTGRLIEESSLCEPVSGMVSINQWGNSSGMASTNVTTVSKEIDDLYWRVVSVRSESETSEYFVRELRGFEDFICDYVDI